MIADIYSIITNPYYTARCDCPLFPFNTITVSAKFRRCGAHPACGTGILPALIDALAVLNKMMTLTRREVYRTLHAEERVTCQSIQSRMATVVGGNGGRGFRVGQGRAANERVSEQRRERQKRVRKSEGGRNRDERRGRRRRKKRVRKVVKKRKRQRKREKA